MDSGFKSLSLRLADWWVSSKEIDLENMKKEKQHPTTECLAAALHPDSLKENKLIQHWSWEYRIEQQSWGFGWSIFKIGKTKMKEVTWCCDCSDHTYNSIHISNWCCKIAPEHQFQQEKRTSNHLFTGEGAAAFGVQVACYMKDGSMSLVRDGFDALSSTLKTHLRKILQKTKQCIISLGKKSCEIERRRRSPIHNLPIGLYRILVKDWHGYWACVSMHPLVQSQDCFLCAAPKTNRGSKKTE